MEIMNAKCRSKVFLKSADQKKILKILIIITILILKPAKILSTGSICRETRLVRAPDNLLLILGFLLFSLKTCTLFQTISY